MAAEEADVDIEGDPAAAVPPPRGSQENTASGLQQDHYLDSTWRTDNGLIPWTLDNTISAENRAAIEKMLLEEEYYMSNKLLPDNFWLDHKENNKKCMKSPQKSGKLTIQSPAKPASHSVKWTVGEKELFEQGLAKFGRRWTKIAKLIGSRNVLQVRSYARQYLKKKTKLDGLGKGVPKLESSSHLQAPDALAGEKSGAPLGLQGHADPKLNAVKIEALSDDEEVDITDESDEFFPTPLRNPSNVLLLDVSNNADHKMDPQGFIPPETQDQAISSAPREDLHSASQEQREAHSALGVSSWPQKPSCNGGRCDQVYDNQTSSPGGGAERSASLGDGEQGAGPELGPGPKDSLDREMLFHPSCQVDEESPEDRELLKAPEQEVEINRDTIQEEEKQAIPEFFEGRQAKTPERYLKIRNYILDQWGKCKPKYLNKTSVRPGLKNCGDVNCIGRIHTYLELIGAINFGCEQAVYNRPQPADKTRVRDGRDAEEAYQLAQRLQSMRARRRRVRDPWGNWCDARDLEGQTFEHLSAEELARRREDEKNKPTKAPKAPRLPKSSFDPFQLIPCSLFSEAKQEPFQVQVASEALLIMDLHAHISMAEVIGLLGGRYLEAEKVIEVCAAEPCNSLSTGLQCEMDPVSQTQASETLAARGYSVIGWYHSHPAFDPNPSLRDIDTQAKYQSYFSRGGAMFIGMIISPYNRNNPLPYSQITCLVISDEISSDGSYRVPYKFEVQQMSGEPRWELVFEKTRWMIEKYRLSLSGIPMDKIFHRGSDLTCLQKLLMCLRKTLGKVTNCHVAEEFLVQVENLFLSHYRSKAEKSRAGEACPVCPPQLSL
ncbi:histone H2A deubiquitinase MYSM1 [Trichosurus vulpecula]|uniref:histone H2A deubiquitinase MYSM1 n=1 Tax=Trichosurus vulpecula TaxID=9337 RepID=UPI00186ADA18|nr:histone H2A deubiquitinase MYSM1 [Trichosurus vulpecula]